jgi:zinc ribbon protein
MSIAGLVVSLTPLQIFFDLPFFWLFCAFSVAAVIVFILVALWVYRDAESRGMSAGLWVVALILASLFFTFVGGLVVLILYLIIRTEHPMGGYPVGYAPPPGYYQYPPPQPMGPAPPPAGVVGIPGLELPRNCRNCGTRLNPGAAFCPYCGAKV